jgi:RES domain-containing protein
VRALYLALTLPGAILETARGFTHRFEPLTICCYDVDVDDIVGLTTDVDRRRVGADLIDMARPWMLDLAERREPASWTLAKRLIAGGAAGILVPSFAIGARFDMHNLVLWTWGPDRPHRVHVYDPAGRLPKHQTSWDSP